MVNGALNVVTRYQSDSGIKVWRRSGLGEINFWLEFSKGGPARVRVLGISILRSLDLCLLLSIKTKSYQNNVKTIDLAPTKVYETKSRTNYKVYKAFLFFFKQYELQRGNEIPHLTFRS